MGRKVRLVGRILIFIIITFLLVRFEKEWGQSVFLSTIITIVLERIILYIFDVAKKITLLENWKKSQRNLEKSGDLKEDTYIRISFAYLFRIKVNGKYFLVKNTRSGKYQPVGGAYKYFSEEADYLSSELSVENDDWVPIDNVTEGDYRLLVKNKTLNNFVKRFNKTQDRENVSDLSREFIEEIFSTNIVDKEEFGDLSYRYCGRHMTKIEKTVFNHFELLLADIVEVKLTNSQKILFQQLIDKKSDKYIFASEEEIISLGIQKGTGDFKETISNHTFKILSKNQDNLVLRNRYKEIFTIETSV